MRYFGSFRNEKFPSVSRLTYRINSFSNFDARKDNVPKSLSIGSYGYNIRLAFGKIKTSYGTGFAKGKNGSTLPSLQEEGERILSVHSSFVGGGKLIAYTQSGKFYSVSLTEPEEAFTYHSGIIDSSGAVTFINHYMDGADATFIYTSSSMYKFDASGLSRTGDSTGVKGCCMHYDRVFGVLPDENAVVFSKLLDPFEFAPEAGGGKIKLLGDGGKLLSTVSLGSAVYIFREHSVYRLSALVDPTDFSLKEVLHLSYPVRERSIASDGRNIYFVAGEEIYKINGTSVEKPYENFTPLIASAENAVGAYMLDRYFLSCKMRPFGAETVGLEGMDGKIVYNNALFSFGSHETDIVRGIGVEDFSAVPGEGAEGVLMALSGDYAFFAGALTGDGKFFGSAPERFWSSHPVNLGDSEALKKAKKLYLTTEYPLTIGAESENGASESSLYGGTEAGFSALKTPPGAELRLYMKATGDIYVSDAVVVVDEFVKYVPGG